MGKTKIKIINPFEEKAEKLAKSRPVKANGAAEHTPDPENADQAGAKQTPSETDRTSSTLRPDKPVRQPKKRFQNIAKTKVRGKRYQEVARLVDPTKRYPLEEAVGLAQSVSYSKFTGSIEAHINTTLTNIRGTTILPFSSGKKITILAFPPSSKTSAGQVDQMKKEGIVIGDENTIEEINKGKINFDTIVATPEWMPKLAKVAKVLGPRGLMPSPKNETVTENLSKTIKELQGGKIEYKTEKDGKVIHLTVGKTDQSKEEIAANLKIIYNNIGSSKIKKMVLSPSMGVGVKVDLSSI